MWERKEVGNKKYKMTETGVEIIVLGVTELNGYTHCDNQVEVKPPPIMGDRGINKKLSNIALIRDEFIFFGVTEVN